MALHEPVNPWVFNVRAPYQREASKAVGHLVSIGITRIAVLQTDDSFGSDSALGAEKGFAHESLQKLPIDCHRVCHLPELPGDRAYREVLGPAHCG
jgi:hypothetical protein